MNQLESKLSRDFINRLRQEVSDAKNHIKIIKIHGGNYQTLGVSDYLIWYKGTCIACEFKVFPNAIKEGDAQYEFLSDIHRTGNVALCITFDKNTSVKYSPLFLIEEALVERRLMVSIKYG